MVATGCGLRAACRAKSMPSVDLPMAGRPATMTSCPGCKPCVTWSMLRKPVATPRLTWPFWMLLIWASVASETAPMVW